MKKFYLLILAGLLSISIYSRDAATDIENTESDLNTDKSESVHEITLTKQYVDIIKPITIDDVEFHFDYVIDRQFNNTELSFGFDIKNPTDITKNITIGDILVTRESNGVTYDANMLLSDSKHLNLKSGLTASYLCSSIIPSSFEDENYYIDIPINDTIVRIYLYSAPDSMRKKLTVSYYIDDQLVHTATTLEGKRTSDYSWESDDKLYYCNTWACENREDKYFNNGTLKDSITLVGKKRGILNCSTTSSDKYTVIWGLNDKNYTPRNGTLVIPAEVYGKPTLVSGTFFLQVSKEVHTIYVERVAEIGFSFFDYGHIKYVYFAGSQTEWNQYDLDVPSNVKIFFNTSFKTN